jgi:hypothetical protein
MIRFEVSSPNIFETQYMYGKPAYHCHFPMSTFTKWVHHRQLFVGNPKLSFTSVMHAWSGGLGLIVGSFDKVTVSICVSDLFLHSMITSQCTFPLIYSCTCLALFPRGQWMQVHDSAKYDWLLFTQRKWVESTYANNDLWWLTLKIHR